MNKRHLRACIIAVLVWSCISCVKDPVTGRSTLNFMSENQEIQMGASSHESVVISMGLYEEGNWQPYIDKIGQEIAGISHRSNLTYNFNVVDSPVVNAFALPGGWIYFTRGILAHFNSEDELAGVMGHEVGHVVARHSAEQYSRQQLATLGLGVAMVFSEDVRRFGAYAQMGLGLLFLKFSRNQESESDMLGVQYTTQLGYDSHEMAGFFRTIARLSNTSSGEGPPNFLSTHPNPLNREKRVHELTDKYRAEMEYKPRNNNRNTYLRRLEGMVFGEDPRNGYLDEERSTFYHPRWDIQFPTPKNWKMQRNAIQIQFTPESKDAGIMMMQHPKLTDYNAAADEFTKGEGITVASRKAIRVNGASAIRVISEIAGQDASQSMGVVSYFMNQGGKVYVGHGFTQANKLNGMLGTFERTLKGFRRLNYQPAKRKQPVRLRIKPAPRDSTLENALKALGAKQDQLATLSLLNGLELQDSVKRGFLLKTLSK